ncbi:hypothetical protein DENSPDRAFT_885808 [Dentipellis sp. KUC8613]|nr:hypothetical protein DENSPDRAFT_885808 [Dentipellis sp. KUC8613]
MLSHPLSATVLLSLLDSTAFANFTTSFLMEQFSLQTPGSLRMHYFSAAAPARLLNAGHPLSLSKLVFDSAEKHALTHEREDGEAGNGGGGREKEIPIGKST